MKKYGGVNALDPLTLSTNTCVVGSRIFHLAVLPADEECQQVEIAVREVVINDKSCTVQVKTRISKKESWKDRGHQQEYSMCAFVSGSVGAPDKLFVLRALIQGGRTTLQASVVSVPKPNDPCGGEWTNCEMKGSRTPKAADLHPNIYMCPYGQNKVVIMSDAGEIIYLASVESANCSISPWMKTEGRILRTVPVPVYGGCRLRTFGEYALRSPKDGEPGENDYGTVTEIIVDQKSGLINIPCREFPRRYMTSAVVWTPEVTFVFGGIATHPTDDLLAYVTAENRTELIRFKKSEAWPLPDALCFLMCRDRRLYILGGIGSRSVWGIEVDKLVEVEEETHRSEKGAVA